MFGHLLRPVARQARNGSRSYIVMPEGYKPPSIDEAVVPEGSWQALYDKRQRTFNFQLIGTVVTLVVTTIIGLKTETLYFNYLPPERKPQ